MQKQSIFDTYVRELRDIGDIEFMPAAQYGQSNNWLTVITLKENSKIKPLDVMMSLDLENIESRPAWKPMHLQPVFKDYKFFSHNHSGISISEDIFNRGVCLPSDTKMTESDLQRVANIIKKLF
jgi:dTDP-4-amino-4,6-dideoxygalactose transaminase